KAEKSLWLLSKKTSSPNTISDAKKTRAPSIRSLAR
ncbi:hypothetical protein MPH_07476, partial [Macrophomina phaseolina MS6]